MSVRPAALRIMSDLTASSENLFISRTIRDVSKTEAEGDRFQVRLCQLSPKEVSGQKDLGVCFGEGICLRCAMPRIPTMWLWLRKGLISWSRFYDGDSADPAANGKLEL